MANTIEEAIKELQDLLDIQMSDGTWNFDNYMHGMANGMIIAMSILTDDTPEFLSAPETFLRDIKMLDQFNKSSVVLTKNNGRKT